MFTAALMVCSVVAGTCVTLTDDLGPYPSRAECETRIEQGLIPAGVYFLQEKGMPPPYIIQEATCSRVEDK